LRPGHRHALVLLGLPPSRLHPHPGEDTEEYELEILGPDDDVRRTVTGPDRPDLRLHRRDAGRHFPEAYPASAFAAATQLAGITTEQFLDKVPTLNPREMAHVHVSIDFPGSPTDHALVAALDDASEVWDLIPMMEFLLENTTDPNRISFLVTGVYKLGYADPGPRTPGRASSCLCGSTPARAPRRAISVSRRRAGRQGRRS
jgi:hypothetical protein